MCCLHSSYLSEWSTTQQPLDLAIATERLDTTSQMLIKRLVFKTTIFFLATAYFWVVAFDLKE